MNIELQAFLEGHNFTVDSTGTRKPPVGEENEVTSVDGRMSTHSSVSGKSEATSTATPRRTDIDLGYEPEGSDSPLPAYKRWKLSLHNMLDDNEGLLLFRNFMEKRQEADLIQCWLAFKGFKTMGNKQGNNSGNSSAASSTTGPLLLQESDLLIYQKRIKLAKVIYRKFLDNKNSTVVKNVIKDATKQYIRKQIKILSNKESNAGEIDMELLPVFDQAQNEIEMNFEKNAYPSFLKSDLFYQNIGQSDSKLKSNVIQNIKPQQTSKQINTQPNAAAVTNRHGHYLPTLDENEVLAAVHGNKTLKGHGHSGSEGSLMRNLMKQNLQSNIEKNGYPTDDFSRPALPYYTPSVGYWVPPASANVSDQASSDATSDTLSVTDGSVDAIPSFPPTRKGHKRLIRSHIKKNVHCKEGPDPRYMPCPLPMRTHEIKMQADMATKRPEAFFQLLCAKLEQLVEKQKAEEETDQILESHLERVLKTPSSIQSPSGRDSPSTEAQRIAGLAMHSKKSPNKSNAVESASWDGMQRHSVQSISSNETLTNKSQEGGAARGKPVLGGRKQGVPGMPLNAVPDVATPDNPLDRQQMIQAWVLQNSKKVEFNKRKNIKGVRKDGEGVAAIANPRIQAFVTNRVNQVQNLPQQPFSQDPSMPLLEAPNANNTIEEVKRRLIEEAEGNSPSSSIPAYISQMGMHQSDAPTAHKQWTPVSETNKPMHRANPVPPQHNYIHNSIDNNVVKPKHRESLLTETTVMFKLPGERDFYKVRTMQQNITLAHFKLLTNNFKSLRKGNFKFFFKQYSHDIAAPAWVQLEKDNERLPYWENKIVAKVENFKIDGV